MAYLIVREPGRVAYTVALAGAVTAGRDAGNDLVLADSQVSRRHARIEPADGGHRVVDLGSTHGVLVNGAATREQRLRDGDLIQIGAVVAMFRDGPQDDDGAIFRTVTGVAAPPPRGAGPEARRLRVLFDVGRVIAALDDVDGALERVLEMTLDVLECERGLIGLADGSGAGRRIARGDGDEPVITPAVRAAILDRRECVLVRERAGAPSAIGAPLESGGQVRGFLYLDDHGRAARFGVEDLDFLAALGRLAAAALEQAETRRRLAAVAAALVDAAGAPPMIGDSEPMRRLRAEIDKCARGRDTAVLIRGETGTGKELIAAHLHARSARAGEAFVAVNCAAIPDNLIESELFGHVKGAFTGATQGRRGRFACADRGTLLLDEVADLSLAAQAKLLRAIEEGEVQPLGAEAPLRVDVRVLSATHKDLEAEVAAGRFRQDLYYRLDVVTIEAPPLRARGDDVLVLAEHFRAALAPRMGKTVTGFTAAARDVLRADAWPGNIRQLRNEIERAVLLAEGALIDADDLRLRATPRGGPWSPIEDAERALLVQALRDHGDNIQAAARALGVSRGTLYRKITKYGLAARAER